jgi:hypothetical protein
VFVVLPRGCVGRNGWRTITVFQGADFEGWVLFGDG